MPSTRFHVDPAETVDIYEFEPDDVLSDTPPNVITIRARMDVATAGKVSSELMQLGADNKPELHVGAHAGALLLHNILRWRGPDFDDLPCTPANIRALPSPESDPFIEKVANEIGARNRKRASPNAPSPATPSTSASAGAADSTAAPAAGPVPPSANGISKSPLVNATIGRLNKSGG
jgi:hypothetical protein